MSGSSVLGIGPPSRWAWPTLRGLVIARGAWRIHGLPRRYVAEVAERAGEHGLALRIINPDVAELHVAESGARRGSAVGPRGPRKGAR